MIENPLRNPLLPLRAFALRLYAYIYVHVAFRIGPFCSSGSFFAPVRVISFRMVCFYERRRHRLRPRVYTDRVVVRPLPRALSAMLICSAAAFVRFVRAPGTLWYGTVRT